MLVALQSLFLWWRRLDSGPTAQHRDLCQSARYEFDSGLASRLHDNPKNGSLVGLVPVLGLFSLAQDLADLPRFADEVREEAEVLLFMAQASCHD